MDNVDYYSNIHGESARDTAPDWTAVLELLGTGALFSPGGRYRAVDEVLDYHNPVESLLEVGCGLGETTAWMLRYSKQAVGSDIWLQSPLKREQPLPLRFCEMDADRVWPFANSSFDVVVAMMVLEHVFDPFHFVKECARVMKSDGTLFLNIPLISFYRHRLDIIMGRVPTTSSPDWFERGLWDGAHIHYFNLPLLRKLLGTVGLKVQKKYALGRFHQLKVLWPSLLCADITLVVTR